MPTPFMHMALGQRLIADPDLSNAIRASLRQHWGAFLLGSIAPDARVSSGLRRAQTHFFEYAPKIEVPPAVRMLNDFPSLRHRATHGNLSQAVFVCGYAAHLSMDETWCVEMLFPHFHGGNPQKQFVYLHLLLGYLDQRDRASLGPDHYSALCAAQPDRWLPFMTDADLTQWRDIVANQLAPEGQSRTLEILGPRINLTSNQMSNAIDDPATMQEVWHNTPLATIHHIESAMYRGVRETVIAYFEDRL